MFLPSSDHVLSCTADKTQHSSSPGELGVHVTGEYIRNGKEELDTCMRRGLMRFGDGSEINFKEEGSKP